MSSDKFLAIFYNVLQACMEQILWLLGPFFLIGSALYWISKYRDAAFAKSVGLKAELYLTGWIGTPVHEMGHAVFCVLFWHKITEAKFLSPREDGTLGYVKHEYNPKNSYQKIGNFFIGIAPMLFGAVVIYALFGIFLPEYLPQELSGSMVQTGWEIFKNFFSISNFSDWRFWVFIYLSLGVSSHMTLSFQDFKGAAGGFFTLLCLIFLVNLIACSVLTFGLKDLAFSEWLVVKTNIVLALFYSIMLYSLALSTIYLGFSYLVLVIYKLLPIRKNEINSK